MRQTHLFIFAFITRTLGLPNQSLSEFAQDKPPPPGSNTDSDSSQICLSSGKNGRSNGISQQFYYGFADACKAAIYPHATPADRQKDLGGVPPVSFRYDSDSEGWAARLEYGKLPTGTQNVCNNIARLKCSDLVGANADGKGSSDFAKNVAYCSDKNRKSWGPRKGPYYHGGEIAHAWQDGSQMIHCATLKIWRCKEGQCGADFDAQNDPEGQVGTSK